MPHSKTHSAKPAAAAKTEAKASPSKPAAKTANEAGKVAKEASKTAKSEASPRHPKSSDLSAKVLRLIAEEMAIEEAELTANASFKEDLNLDEIDVAELLMQAEHSLNVAPFNEEDWEACETVGDFISLVESHAGGVKSRAARRA